MNEQTRLEVPCEAPGGEVAPATEAPKQLPDVHGKVRGIGKLLAGRSPGLRAEPDSGMLSAAPGGAPEGELIDQQLWGAVATLRERGDSVVVLPQRFSGEVSASSGDAAAASSACACTVHSAAATSASGGRATYRVKAAATSPSSTAPSTGSGHGAGSLNSTVRPWPAADGCCWSISAASTSRAGAFALPSSAARALSRRQGQSS
jgi:hypothetical protein